MDEIVAKNEKARKKKEAAEEKRKEAEARLEAEILEKMRREKNKRVSGPRPISAAGSDYKVEVKGPKKEEPKRTNKGTTNPKNQSGKKKNAGKRKKK